MRDKEEGSLPCETEIPSSPSRKTREKGLSVSQGKGSLIKLD